MNLRLSSFSIIVGFTCLSIIGLTLISLVTVKLSPSRKESSLKVNYRWKDASAKLIEKKVTSKLEGVFNTVKGIKEISSTSSKGKGNISIELKKNINLDASRFEIANLIRQSYSELPEGVSYPLLSISTVDENDSPILTYTINSEESPYYIAKYADNFILPKLSMIKGVNKLNLFGTTPFEWVINYDSSKITHLSITVNEIKNAINTYLIDKDLGYGIFINKRLEYDSDISVKLSYNPKDNIDWNNIPIKKIGSRIVFLKDIAKVKYKEAEVKSYYRINGLNSVNMTIYADDKINTIDLASTIKSTISNLDSKFGKGYSIILAKDSTEYIVEELNRIKKRTLFSLILLLTLILLINRSWKYGIILLVSIITNLSIALIFYYSLGIELQLYSFAGITISFGIIIDNSIIMIDHIRNKGNKKAFLAILAATLTTIAALTIIFLLNEQQQNNLIDFGLVVAINIGVSLITSLLLIPALIEKMGFYKVRKTVSIKRKKRAFRFILFYRKTILWLKKPVIKWSLVVIFILGFGIPFHFLPEEIEKEVFYKETYNKTIGSEWFGNNIRPPLEKTIGGALRLFTENVFEKSYYSDIERTKLTIKGIMPEGCTIEQLNGAIRKIEYFLSEFNEVELFETNILSYKNSNIAIYFKDEHELTGFPYYLKNLLQIKAIKLGGVSWIINGVGRGFSNASGNEIRKDKIILEGYNYNKLYAYAKQLKQQLLHGYNFRVKDTEITSGVASSNILDEYYLNFDEEKLELLNLSQRQLYNYLKNQTHSESLSSIILNNELQDVKLNSNNYKKFSVWDLKNKPVPLENGIHKLEQLSTIEKKKTGNTIRKINQQYNLTVAYNFLGTGEMARKVRRMATDQFKPKLPIGYKVLEKRNNNWDNNEKTQYYFLFIIVGIIFLICAVLLESLKQPLVIISMIPISFIGVFLTFYLFDFNFDQGGYASFILLCGISVNSALYIINDFNNLKVQYPKRNLLQLYFKAFNYKIIPILLTIMSTIVGLIPFIWDGQNEVFWFSFAVGSIGGLLFSILGILIYLPLFILKKQ